MIKGFDHIAIISSSEKSVEFYQKLGFREIFRKERQSDTIVILEGTGIQIEIFIDANHPKSNTKVEPLGLRHIAFQIDDIEKIVTEYECGPIMTDWFGKRYCFATDPDGIPIEFCEKC